MMTRSMRLHWGLRIGVVVALLFSAACGTAYAPSGVDVVVRRPPPRRVEVVSSAPANGYVWIPGHYAWQGGDYVWLPGRWEAPPQPTLRNWVPGHWARARTGWYWVEGHWR